MALTAVWWFVDDVLLNTGDLTKHGRELKHRGLVRRDVTSTHILWRSPRRALPEFIILVLLALIAANIGWLRACDASEVARVFQASAKTDAWSSGRLLARRMTASWRSRILALTESGGLDDDVE